MHRVIVSILVVIAAVGCRGQSHPCKTDSNCAEGFRCEAELGACLRTDCEPACGTGSFCRDRGCEARYDSVVIIEPASHYSRTVVTLRAELRTRPDAPREDPATLSFQVKRDTGEEVTRGTLTKLSPGVYEGEWTAPGDGSYVAVATYGDAGLVSAEHAVIIDTQPPAFTVTVPSPTRPGTETLVDRDPEGDYQNAWRRDEVLPLEITSDDANIDPASVKVSIKGLDGNVEVLDLPVESKGTACGKAYCGVGQINLWQAAMPAFRGTFGLEARGKDLAGNSATAEGSVKVTRWKWARQVVSGADALVASPAVGAMGDVYVGSQNLINDQSGYLVALKPDGAERWRFSAGSISASPAVGAHNGTTEKVYVAARTATKASFFALNGIAESEAPVCNFDGERTEASMGLGTTSTPDGKQHETVVGLLNVGSGRAVAVRPTAELSERCDTRSSVGSVVAPRAIISGGTDYFLGVRRDIQGLSLGTPFWTPLSGYPQRLDDTSVNIGMSGTKIFGTSEEGGVFSFPIDGGLAWSYLPNRVPAYPAFIASVGSSDNAIYGNSYPELTAIALESTTPTKVIESSGIIRAAPLFGQGGIVYTASDSGIISARNPTTLAAIWEITSGLNEVVASPNIDCSRDDEGTALPGRPGVLYVPERAGRLIALIVDSRGIDTDAPWPKYQHDPRNTGNAATPLSSFRCP